MATKKTTKKSTKKTTKKTVNKPSIISAVILLIVTIITGLTIKINIENGKIEATIEYSKDEIPALIEDRGEVKEYDGEEIKTVEEVDGGLFEDKDTGISLSDGQYEDLGSAVELFDTSTPEAFRNDTLGKCIYANNRFGAQCVSLARSFWWSYAGRDVSTCGTGMANGMMNCAGENAGDEFLVFWGSNGIQSGDWLVFDGGQYGHVGMALGEANNGYVALLGENQGGRYCEGGGAATNIINISLKNLIGYYRPKAYIKPEPVPEPTPSDAYTVKRGDTLGDIARSLGWYTGDELFGDNGYTQKLADANGIKNRGLIYVGQEIKRL